MLHHECRHEAVPLPSPQEDITSAPRDLTIIARPQPNTAYAAEDTKSGYLRPSLRKPTRLLKLNYHPHLCQHARPSPMSGPLRTRPRCSPLPIPCILTDASHRISPLRHPRRAHCAGLLRVRVRESPCPLPPAFRHWITKGVHTVLCCIGLCA